MVVFAQEAKIAVDAFVTPVWVIDVERADLIWANRSALSLFAAASLEDLLAREQMLGANDFLIPELRRLLPGGRLESEFRVRQPDFQFMVICTFTGIEGDSGQTLSLVEAHADRNAPTSLARPSSNSASRVAIGWLRSARSRPA